MSGYDQHLDYGGAPWTWRREIAFWAIMGVIFGGRAWYLFLT